MTENINLRAMQNHEAYLAGTHDFQEDIQRLAESDLVSTLLETVMLATSMRFAGVARVTADRWVACRTVDDVHFGIDAGDEIAIESTFCQSVRDTSEMVIFSDALSDPLYKDNPIASAFGIVSYASVPIYRSDGTFFGTLCAIDTEPKDVNNPRSVAMLQMFANLIGRSLETEERLEAQELLVDHERKLLRIQEEFLAILGHDLKNPVAALSSGVRLLRKQPQSEEGYKLLALMRTSVHRTGELIENMMQHAKARLGGGITISAKSNAPLSEELVQIIEEFRVAEPDRKIELNLELSAPITCDSPRIVQAVSNLISNAIRHGAPDTSVKMTATCQEHSVVIEVENQGDAIPADVLTNMFEPFQRGHTARVGGLGLGLHIASSIAKAHDGCLSAASEGTSTVFRLEFPLRKPAVSC
ncbi:GAF domain-containing sensor histidine kinase [Arenibacterium halophilum]|uniref:histidine kinase n=1 Tax=Arenibacterium halophilum TaxID=2583821 RepID=A0ABY2X945_9RHOB|nr:GAF domain-containing sensor histidine kinase [Arenibacterium halophilum]TMV11927.1 GAF domain-containing sensor histidine kinase [Arenibacterium halophilum]